jgi:hypothetical protein
MFCASVRKLFQRKELECFLKDPFVRSVRKRLKRKEIAGGLVLLLDHFQIFKERRGVAKMDAAGRDQVASAPKNYYNKCVKLTRFKS